MKKSLLIISLILLGGFYFFSGKDKLPEDVTEELDEKVIPNIIKKAQQESLGKVKPVEAIKKPKVPNQEKAIIPPFKPANPSEESLKKLGVVFEEVFKDKKDSDSLRESLSKLDLKPTLNINSNPYTGSMKILRTKENLNGTRYVHAQYVTGENGAETLQHLSFEYRPGPNALQRATSAIKTIFDIKTEPQHSNGEFVSFKLGSEYIIWLKRMGEEDLKDDPFNAYTKNDVGTIRVAIELEIHGEETDTHVFPDDN